MKKKAGKAKAVLKSSGIDVPATKPRDDRRHSIETRKIKNGFVVRRSGHLPDEYASEETYFPSKPKIDVSIKGKAARAKRLKDVPL